MRLWLGEDVSLFDCKNDLPEIYEITSSTTEVSLYRMLPLRIIRKYEEYQMGLRCIREEKIRSR
jgi:hypothetical protein